jgi:hypothetical protein
MKKKPALTRLYELVATFVGRETQIVCHIDEEERQRLLSCFDDEETKHRFYGVNLPDGLECYLNTARIERVNLLDYLAGVPFEARPKLTAKQADRQIAIREASDIGVILRLWTAGETEPFVCHDVHHEEWIGVRFTLEEGGRFLRFSDEDDEEVLFGTDHLDAVEMIDPFFLDEKQVEALLSRYAHKPTADDANDADDPAQKSSASGSPTPF